MQFEKILVDTKEELLRYKEDIFILFEQCFGQKMDEDLWQWAYIKNPNDHPIVSLYYDGLKLVGHYAVVPVLLWNKSHGSTKTLLSMTTMVDKKYRRLGIFILQANEVYEKAKDLGYSLVYGFPNKKSAPGFKKRLHWMLETDLFVVKLQKQQLMKLNMANDEDSLGFNIVDEDNLVWRLKKPGNVYFYQGKSIFKSFEGGADIMFNAFDYDMFNKDMEYNVLVDDCVGGYECETAFNYVFGYKVLNSSLRNVVFKKDLIMSDVF